MASLKRGWRSLSEQQSRRVMCVAEGTVSGELTTTLASCTCTHLGWGAAAQFTSLKQDSSSTFKSWRKTTWSTVGPQQPRYFIVKFNQKYFYKKCEIDKLFILCCCDIYNNTYSICTTIRIKRWLKCIQIIQVSRLPLPVRSLLLWYFKIISWIFGLCSKMVWELSLASDTCKTEF